MLHFDGKKTSDFFGHDHEQRLAVLVSSGEDYQLLGIPELKAETGKEMAQAMYNLIVEWGIKDSIMAVCADTTNSNTGRGKIGGAIFHLEKLLGREILYFACRHHVYEVLLRAAFESKFGKTTGPDVPLFAQFKKAWGTFDHKKYETGIKSKRVKSVLKDSVDGLLEFCSEQLEKNFDRADYKELLELTLLFLGKAENVKFRSPGAVHHARFMSKAIYCLKMYLFRKQHKLNKPDAKRLEDVCLFIVLFYVRAWTTSELSIQAPNNDLQFLKNVAEFASIDRRISDAVVEKMAGHLWYLNPECVVLTLYDDNVSHEIKRAIAKKILNSKQPTVQTDKTQQYEADEDSIRSAAELELPDFVTDESINFFNRFKLSTNFLRSDPTKWKNDDGYMCAFEAIRHMKVVNDCAERGVKLMSDFAQALTTKQNDQQHLLQTVSKNRKMYPNSKKQTLIK